MKLGTNDIGSVYLGTNAVQKVYLGTNEVWTSNSGLLADYPNAAAAYSLRLLQTAYTDDAIRVRRASDNTEQDIGFVDGELDTSSLTTFCSGTDGFVKTWYDQSGNARDAEQTTAANQPQIVSSGSVILNNGKPSVKFNSSNTLNFTTISINSVFITYKVDVFNTINYALYNPAVPQGFFLGGTFGGVDGLGIFKTTGRSSNLGENTNNNLGYWNYNSTNYQVGLNSSSLVNLSASLILECNTIGRSGGFSINGNLQELILYPSDQSSNRTGIETNINDFYSIY